MKYIISFLVFSLVLISCDDMQTVVDLEVPEHDPVLVLNGLLDTDTNVQLVVSHSVGAFSNNTPSFINNANVLLRAEVLNKLNNKRNTIIVTYSEALSEKVMSRKELRKNTYDCKKKRKGNWNNKKGKNKKKRKMAKKTMDNNHSMKQKKRGGGRRRGRAEEEDE